MVNKLESKKRLTFLISIVALSLISFSAPVRAAANETSSGIGQEYAVSSLMTVAVIVAVTVVAGAYCLAKGAMIGASAMTEKPEASSWGLTLEILGLCIIAYGLAMALLILLPIIDTFY